VAEPEHDPRFPASALPRGWRVVADAGPADPWAAVEAVVHRRNDSDLVFLHDGVVRPLRGAPGDFSGDPAVKTWGQFKADGARRERQRGGVEQ